jgi:hypothetical protein
MVLTRTHKTQPNFIPVHFNWNVSVTSFKHLTVSSRQVCIRHCICWNSSVSYWLRCELGDLCIGAEMFFLLHSVRIDSAVQPWCPKSWIATALFPEVYRTGIEADLEPPPATDVKNTWNYPPIKLQSFNRAPGQPWCKLHCSSAAQCLATVDHTRCLPMRYHSPWQAKRWVCFVSWRTVFRRLAVTCCDVVSCLATKRLCTATLFGINVFIALFSD